MIQPRPKYYFTLNVLIKIDGEKWLLISHFRWSICQAYYDVEHSTSETRLQRRITSYITGKEKSAKEGNFVKNAVVFTGLPRMSERFEQSVSEMTSLRQRGLIDKIVFVTWHGMLDDQEPLEGALQSAGVEIIEKEESPVGGSGNIWHQMRALDFGLRAIPSDYRVLKTRTDVHIDPEFLAELLAGDIDYVRSSAGSGVFTERLWVPFFKIGAPFYICDYCFYGHKTDVERLVNYDARYDFLFHVSKGLPEVRRYIDPYLSEYRFLETYLTNYSYDRAGDRLLDRSGLLQSRLDSRVYGAFLGFYYKVMMEDFYVNYDPVTFQDGWWVDGRPPKNLANIEDSFVKNFTQGPTQGRHDLFCYYSSWLDTHFGDQPSDDVPDQILRGIDRSFDDWASYEIDTERLRRDVKRDKQFFDLTPYPKNPVTEWVTEQVLTPLGLRKGAKDIYRRLTR